MFSPFADNWRIRIQDEKVEPVYSVAFPVTYLKSIGKKWTMAVTPLIRWNSYRAKISKESLQAGGAFLLTYKKHHNISYKAGLCYNREFFGHFFMPLIGLDWRIDPKNNLFGVLPGNFTFEHKVTGKFYYGATFRAITNSYILHNVNPGQSNVYPYARIEDNQVGVFGDVYLTKNIVANGEAIPFSLAQVSFRL